MRLRFYLALYMGLLAGTAGLHAQPTDPMPLIKTTPSQSAALGLQCPCITISALTAVKVEITAPLSSKTSVTGEMFSIRLAAPIVINGAEVIPAGMPGVGEVIHAKRSGGGGGAGELLAAARYIEVDGRKMRLRSLHLSSAGHDQMGLALASSYAIGLFAMAVTGRSAEIPAGTQGDAKLAEDFIMPISEHAPRLRATLVP